MNQFGSSMQRLRCPSCGGGWCRCRTCGARYRMGVAVACAAHGAAAMPLFCRCGAVAGAEDVRTPAGALLPYICDVAAPRMGLMGRLGSRERARARFGWLVRATRRAATAARRRAASETTWRAVEARSAVDRAALTARREHV